jgi:D-alanyl-lipoteichoic acid acyltransferase DltB (MBOAT superfamily)
MMKSWIWFRALAVILAIFTLGHTVGTMSSITNTPEEGAVISAMQSHRFPVMGFLRSYWDFYRGFSVTITVLLSVLAVIAWQLGAISRRNPETARPIAITLLIGCAANAVASWKYFFAAPMLTSVATVLCAGVAVALLARERRTHTP